MFELAALFLILGAVVVGFVLLVLLIKVLFHIALIPLMLMGVAIKTVFVAVACVVGLVLTVVLGPILLLFAAVFLLPVLAVGGLAWAGLHALA